MVDAYSTEEIQSFIPVGDETTGYSVPSSSGGELATQTVTASVRNFIRGETASQGPLVECCICGALYKKTSTITWRGKVYCRVLGCANDVMKKGNHPGVQTGLVDDNGNAIEGAVMIGTTR